MKLLCPPLSASDRIPDRFYVVSSAICRRGHNTLTYRVRMRLATFVQVVQVCSILSFSSIEGVCSSHYLSCFEGGFRLLSSSLDVLLTLLLSFNILLLFPEKRLPFPACFFFFNLLSLAL